MIRNFEIQNFRPFDFIRVENCRRLNVLVGDNGSGKTSLLEAIFLALASSSEVLVRLRQLRGLDGTFSGTSARVMDALFGDFFHNNDMSKPIQIRLDGTGDDKRSLVISRSSGSEHILPLDGGNVDRLGPIRMEWTNAAGRTFVTGPVLDGTSMRLPETGEDLPLYFHFGAGKQYGSVEAAGRFSDLSKRNAHRDFVKIFAEEFPWVEDLSVEVHGGAPAIFASVQGAKNKLPLANVSSGINHIVTILLSIASRSQSVATIDEIEDGVYYKHMPAIWNALLRFARQFDSQLFVSTHSKECLEALMTAAGDDNSDIAIWRVERNADGSRSVVQFGGADLRHALELGVDARDGSFE